MTDPIPINIVVEDLLSEAVARAVLQKASVTFAVGFCYCHGGYGYVKQKISGFNHAARGTPFIVIADLESRCPPAQIREWLSEPAHSNLLFRISVKEIESWILADRDGFASFLGVSRKLIPEDVDGIPNPKEFLIRLTRRSSRRSLREAIVPKAGSTAKIGPDYNGELSSFVTNRWNIEEAVRRSDSLGRAVRAVNRFRPVWDNN